MPIAKTGSRAKFKHERIKSPKAFDPRSFRTKRVGASRIIIGCPKGKYSPSTGRCKVGTRVQSILRPKRNPKRSKTSKINMFATHNDTDKWAICVDGYFGLFNTKKDVEKTWSLIESAGDDLGGTPFGSAQILPPRHTVRWADGTEPLGGFDRLSLHRPIDITNYIIQRLKREGRSTVLPKSTPRQRLEAKRWMKEMFGENSRGKRNPCGTRKTNPRKKWYYGPSLTHRGKVLVFPSSRTPTHGTHGRKVKYAVGPFKTSDEASKKARYAKMSAG